MRVFCGRAQCGELLGEVGASNSGMNPNPVWRIQPGWHWRAGILERTDYTLRSERKLIHETFGRQEPRVAPAREANLPIVVRCPKCQSFRLVQPDVVFRSILSR